MAYTSNFTFNELSRIGNDQLCMDQRSIQNSQASSYTLQNYYGKDCTMSDAVKMATSQPGINYSGSQGSDVCGSNIDESSKLLLGGIQTHPRCRIDLYQRPFATVPFLGRGAVNPILESQIQQGDAVTSRRSVTHMAETNYMKYHTTPLINELKHSVQNPENLIESSAHEGWVRGGIPSRELTKDTKMYH